MVQPPSNVVEAPDNNDNQLRQQPQSSSHLIQLPPEIRELIYSQLLCSNGQLIEVVMNHQKCIPHLNHKYRPYNSPAHPVGDSDCFLEPYSDQSMHLVPLLLTCRAIYIDIIHFLYAFNTFSFANLEIATYFSQATARHHLETIRRIRLVWTSTRQFSGGNETNARLLIERMKSLEELTVVLPESDRYWYSKSAFEKFATRLTSITGARLVFEIEGDEDSVPLDRRAKG